jgi:hypothetical protein
LRIIQSPNGISIDQTDHVVDSIIEPYFKLRDIFKLVRITSPFPTDTAFEQQLYESPVLAGSSLHAIELKHDGSLYKWNGALLHVAITTRLDLGYAVMRLSGYIAGATAAIFEALDHVMRYLYFYRHLPIMYPAKPLSRKSLTTHWARGSAEYLGPEVGTCFVNTSDADHARDIRDRRSTTSTIHLLNGVAVSWLCKKQSVSTLHSTGSEIIALATGAKGTINGRAFFLASAILLLALLRRWRTIKLPSSASSLPVSIPTLVISPHASPGYTRCLPVALSSHTTRRPPYNSATSTPNLYAALLTTPNWLFSLVFDVILHIHQNTTFLYFFLIAHYIRIILREVLLYPLLHLLYNFHLSDSFEALRFSNVGGVLGLLRIPRYTPVPWIKDNAILA